MTVQGVTALELDFYMLSNVGWTLTSEDAFGDGEQLGHLAGCGVPVFGIDHIDTDECQIRIVHAAREPRADHWIPQFFDLGAILDQRRASRHRDVQTFIRCGERDIHFRLMRQIAGERMLVRCEEPHLALFIDLLGRHGATRQRLPCTDGRQHAEFDVFDLVAQIGQLFFMGLGHGGIPLEKTHSWHASKEVKNIR